MNIDDKLRALDVKRRNYPIIRGDVKLTLKNPHNGKTEVYEDHNAVTGALSDIFAGNFGGLLNYNNFADLYRTYLGGVLLFASPLDLSDTGYGIPASTSNACVAHAGQTPLTSQGDDTTRGDPDDTGTVLTSGSVKNTFVWSPSAGNGTISSLGLTHSDVGSFGCGVSSQAQMLLEPFAEVACISDRNMSYGDNANAVLAVNTNTNTAYNFYLTSSTSVNIYATPINNNRFKLQGGGLVPLTAYSNKITATLPNSYDIASAGGCYYHFDFANNNLILFGVPTENGTTLYKDVISLETGAVTHSAITVTGALLWKFTGDNTATGYRNTPLSIPTKAIVYNGNLFVYGNKGTGDYEKHPTKVFKIDLAAPANITEVTMPSGYKFDGQAGSRTNERFTSLGGLIVHDSFIINGDVLYPTAQKNIAITAANIYASDGVSAPAFGIGAALNSIAVNKCYLATKFNLANAVTKTAAQSMSIEYTLTEV